MEDVKPLDEVSKDRIARAAIADPEVFNSIISQLWRPFNPERESPWQMHPEAFRFEPQGARLHIAVAPMPERVGNIIVPDAQDGDISGLGVIISLNWRSPN